MAIVITTGADVVSFLEVQHQQVRRMFADVVQSVGDQREEAFDTLRRMLAVHEAAEEEVIHPAALKALVDGEAIIAARLAEESEAKRVLTALEGLEASSEAFEAQFLTLRTSVLSHAEAEERDEFDALERLLDPKQLTRMRKAVEFAESIAPTRPHAGLESAAAHILAGPFVSMLDRARDALGGRSPSSQG